MPTYNYKCDRCDKIISIFQGINDKPLINCDTCNSKINRIITGGTGMIFKGSGFYKTDYTKQKKTNEGAGDSASKEINKNLEKNKWVK